MILNSAYTKCPKCEANFSYTDIKPEKISKSEIWSDGFYMAPMRKDLIKFAKCPSCNTFFWLQENSIEEPTDSNGIKKLDNSWFIDEISSKEINFIKEAFRAGLASTTEKEMILRIKLWQTINHITRKYYSQGLLKTIKQKIFTTTDYKNSIKQYKSSVPLKLKNIIRLLNILKLDKNKESNYVLFAETYREIGDFGKAMVFCHKARKLPKSDSKRIRLLKRHIETKSKTAYSL